MIQIELYASTPEWSPSPEQVVAFKRNHWSLSAEFPEAVPALIKLLKDPDSSVRKGAVNALASIVPAAKEVVPALTEALKDPNEEVRSDAVNALGKIGRSAMKSVSSLIKTLKDSNDEVRRNSAGALGEIGSQTQNAITALTVAACKDPNKDVRTSASYALVQILGQDKADKAIEKYKKQHLYELPGE